LTVLFTAAPGEDGTGGTEVSVGGGSLYERVSIPSASWDASATLGQPSTIANDVAIAFPTAGAAWGTVTHYGLAPAGVEGVADVKWWNVITASKVVDTGDDVSFAIGALVLQLGDPGDTYS